MNESQGKKRPPTTKAFWVLIAIIFIAYSINDNKDKIIELIQFYKTYTASLDHQQEEQAKENQANDLYNKAKADIAKQNFKTAIPLLEAALLLTPKNKSLQVDYIKALIQTLDFSTALDEISGCGYDDECTGLMSMLYEKVYANSISHGVDKNNLALHIRSNSEHTGSNSTLCNTTKFITELATDAVSLSSVETKTEFKKMIENFNPVNEQDIKRYKNTDVDEYETAFYPWLYWQYSDIKDRKKKIDKSARNVNAYTVLKDARDAAISIANHLMDNRTMQDFFDTHSCISLETNQIDYTYFETYYSGMLRGSKDRLLEFDTTDKTKVSNLSNHVESVFNYNLLKTLHTHCEKVGRC